jgi:hypothetical protein
LSAQSATAAVYGVLKGIDSLGPNVYDRIRFAMDDATFNSLFVDSISVPNTTFVHVWMVSRESSSSKDEVLQAYQRSHTIVATGFMGFKDPTSEPVWQAEVETIALALGAFAQRRFNGDFDWSGPPQVEGVKLVMFRNALCHTARIIHPVQEFPLN